MNLIAGLGNPGTKYINTRHNIGFKVVEKLATRYDRYFKKKLFRNAKEAEITISRNKALLIQPLSFMNLSGNSIAHYKERLKISLDKIMIICDDINLPLGHVRVRTQGAAGGHNGLQSVIDKLKTTEFPRLRIGICKDNLAGDLAEYVLSDFKQDEKQVISEAIDKAVDVCECWLINGISKAMNTYNK